MLHLSNTLMKIHNFLSIFGKLVASINLHEYQLYFFIQSVHLWLDLGVDLHHFLKKTVHFDTNHIVQIHSKSSPRN